MFVIINNLIQLMKNLSYFFGLLALLAMSCDSDSDDGDSDDVTEPPVLVDSSILPTQVSIVDSDGDSETIRFVYDGMFLVNEDTADGFAVRYTYENGALVSSFSSGIFESYTYDSSDRVSTISINIDDLEPNVLVYNYNSDNSVITVTSASPEDDEVPCTLTFSNGNLTRLVEGDNATSTYTYDNRNAPFTNLVNRELLLTIDSENIDSIDFTRNNVLTETFLDQETSETETYTYTASNFPRTKTVVDEDGFEVTYTFTYNNDI